MSQSTLTRNMQEEAKSAATQALSHLVRVGQEDVKPQVYHQLQDSNTASQNNKVCLDGSSFPLGTIKT